MNEKVPDYIHGGAEVEKSVNAVVSRLGQWWVEDEDTAHFDWKPIHIITGRLLQMTGIMKVEGIGKLYAEKLKKAGISSTGALLEKGATPKGRKELAEAAGISEKLILEWVNHVDLFRIKGVAEEYSDLLEEAGVDTVVELAQRNSHNLFAKLVEVNEAKKLVRRLPIEKQVENWIVQAKELPRVISY